MKYSEFEKRIRISKVSNTLAQLCETKLNRAKGLTIRSFFFHISSGKHYSDFY